MACTVISTGCPEVSVTTLIEDIPAISWLISNILLTNSKARLGNFFQVKNVGLGPLVLMLGFKIVLAMISMVTCNFYVLTQ